MEFNTYKLQECVELKTGFAFKSKLFNQEGKGIKLVRGKNITTGFLRWGEDTRYWNENTTELEQYFLEENDIVIGMDGSKVGQNYAVVSKNDLPLLLVQRVARLRSKKMLDQKFLYYLIDNTNFLGYINNVKTGTSIPHISGKQILNYEVSIPSIQLQRKIVGIIDPLDKKSKLNKNIILNLEKIARAMFKCWFIDFEFPNDNGEPYKSSGGEMKDSELGKIPKDWEISRLSKFASKMSSGGTPSRKESSYWQNGDIPWIKTKEVKNNYLIKAEEFITIEGLNNSAAKLFEKNTILIAMYGTTAGQLGVLKFEAATNQACCGIVTESTNYLYEYLLRNQKYIKSLATGSAQQNLSKEVIGGLKILSPTIKILREFEDSLVSMSNYRELLIRENEKLSTLRDLLVSKLLNGEIEFPDETEVTEHVPVP